MLYRSLLLALLAGLAIGIAQMGCEAADASDSDTDSDTDTDSDADTDTDTDADSDADSDTDTDADGDGGDTVCDEQDFTIEEEPVRLVFLQDISGSMSGTPLSQAKTAINNIITLWGGTQIQFGFDFYPAGSNVNTTIPIAPAAGTETAITTMVNGLSATGGTPTMDAMENYTVFGYATGFPEAGIDSYLVLITDGQPNSGTAAEFSTLTSSLLANSIKTIAIGFNYTSPTLSAIAAAGGMAPPYNTPINATDSTTLQAAFNSIATAVVTCVFDVQSPDATADPDNVNFYFDGTVVPFNDGCGGSQYGWQWVDAGHTQVEFCTNSCDELQDGDPPEISAAWGCPSIVE